VEEFNSGKTFVLEENDEILFSFNSENYKLTINKIDPTFVSFVLGEDNVQVILNVGGGQDLDLDDDGTFDLSMKVNLVSNDAVDFTIGKFVAEDVVELGDDGEVVGGTEDSNGWIVYVAIIVLILILVFAGFYLYRKRKDVLIS